MRSPTLKSFVAIGGDRLIIQDMLRGLLVLALVMIAVALVFAGAAIVVMAVMLLRPPRMKDARAIFLLQRLSPADLGMEFEEVSFQVIDQSNGGKLTIAGWWIDNPDARGRCAVILHGYSDAKVGGIAWAPLLRAGLCDPGDRSAPTVKAAAITPRPDTGSATM